MFFSLVFFHVKCQISDTLYKSIPSQQRPKNQFKITEDEKRRIVSHTPEYVWYSNKFLANEIDRLARELELQASVNTDVSQKVLDYMALGDYYQYFKDRQKGLGLWVPYYEKVISLAGTDPTFENKIAYACKGIAIYRVQQSKYEEASDLLNKSLHLFTKLNDTAGISSVHAFYYPLYSSLRLYGSAINELNLVLKYMTAAEKKNGMAEYYTNENYQDKALTFLSWFESSNEKRFLDSANTYINRTPLTGNNGLRWKPSHYFLIGYRSFLKNDFHTALANIDSSLNLEEYYAELIPAKLIYKGISLLKLGRNKEAKTVLLDPLLVTSEHYLRAIAYDALYKNSLAEKNYPEAIKYYEISNKYRDSSALITQRGMVFEAM